VLFVCVHNAGRSQMAAALLHLARPRTRAFGRIRSAEDINLTVVEGMRRWPRHRAKKAEGAR
jgi:protein-tyrosine-phosphatase